MLDDIHMHTPQLNTLKSNSMIHYTENEVNGAALKELTGSFEDFKELVPKAGDRLILKKCLREEFAVTHSPEGSLEISASSVTPESQSFQDTDQLSQGQPTEDSSTMCKCTDHKSTKTPHTETLIQINMEDKTHSNSKIPQHS